MVNIYDLDYNELENRLLSLGEKKYRTRQIWEWLYLKNCLSFDEMSNLSKELILKLKGEFSFDFIKIKTKQESKLTNKYLFELSDGNFIEAVLMKHDYGTSICVSSQVGCNMGCTFCESGRLKKVRNLSTYEMVEQILFIQNDLKERIDSVVIMGIGEPFDNYDNVINFIKIINNAYGLAIGARHITVSTCGIIPKVKEFMSLDLQVNLAISLHAPNNEIRSKIMPINNAYPLDELLDVLKEYIAKTNRRVTIEYVMLEYINDSLDNANELAKILNGMNVYVNLIPYNETSHLDFKRSNNINRFYDALKKNKINVTIRKEFGSNLDAACGQLRAKEVNK